MFSFGRPTEDSSASTAAAIREQAGLSFGFDDISAWRRAYLADYLTNDSAWLVFQHIEQAPLFPVAVFSLSGEADPDRVDLWPAGDGLYLHGLAMHRECPLDTDTAVMNWCSARAQALGYTSLRIDATGQSRLAQSLIQSHWFTAIFTVTDDRQHRTVFTRQAGSYGMPRPPAAPPQPDTTAP